jgi:hypothetical protein
LRRALAKPGEQNAGCRTPSLLYRHGWGLALKGFNVVGSIENPPTKPRELERALGGLG